MAVAQKNSMRYVYCAGADDGAVADVVCGVAGSGQEPGGSGGRYRRDVGSP